MPKRPSNDGAAWTAATIRKLSQLAKQGATARAAAAILGRTPAAVQQKAMREGISFRARGPVNKKKSAKKKSAAKTKARKK